MASGSTARTQREGGGRTGFRQGAAVRRQVRRRGVTAVSASRRRRGGGLTGLPAAWMWTHRRRPRCLRCCHCGCGGRPWPRRGAAGQSAVAIFDATATRPGRPGPWQPRVLCARVCRSALGSNSTAADRTPWHGGAGELSAPAAPLRQTGEHVRSRAHLVGWRGRGRMRGGGGGHVRRKQDKQGRVS